MQIDTTKQASFSYLVQGAASTPTLETDAVAIATLEADLIPGVLDTVVPGSVRLVVGGREYDDRQGDLVTDVDPVTGSGLVAGGINYRSGVATLTYWDDGQPAGLEVTSLLTVFGQWTAFEGYFRTAAAPIKPESLQIIATAENGEQITATADQDGNFTHEWVQGTVNYQVGTAAVTFGKRVLDAELTPEEKQEWWYDPANVDEDGMIYRPRAMLPATLRYNAVAFSYIPLDADILGIDAVRLPPDGRVPIYRPGDVVMVMHPDETMPETVSNGGSIATRPRVGWVKVLDANGQAVTDGFTLDRATGVVTFDDVSEIAMPVTVRHTVGDLRLVTDVQINGQLTVSRALTHNYPAGESIVASCLIHGDRRARVASVFDQQTWGGNWSDSQEGSAATATLNLIDHPIQVTNEGCDTDRWVLRVTNAASSQWELISERRGLVWAGTYAPNGDDISPVNPRTRGPDGQGGVPYMVIPGAANGGGWSTGNVVRINTVGAIADFWMARAIQQSDEPLDDGADGCEIYALGNIDRP